MEILNIEAVPFSIPLNTPLKWATGYMEAADHVLIKIETNNDIFGIAEATPRPTIYGETQASIVRIITGFLAPLIIGEDSFDLEKIWNKMNSIAWNPTAKGAIDIALHDLNSKYMGIPLYKMLGGWRDTVPLTWVVTLKSEEEMIQEIIEKISEGYKSFKVKIGLDPEYDLMTVKNIRKEVAPEIDIYVDANQGYSRESALKVLKDMQNLSISCVEEPLPVWDDEGRQRLSKYLNIPILADESVFTVADVYRQIKLGAIGGISIKLPRTGCHLSRKIVSLAEIANLPLKVGTQGETDVGTMAAAHFAAAFKQICLPSEISYYKNFKDGLLSKEISLSDGHIILPQEPGIGISIDWDKFNIYKKV